MSSLKSENLHSCGKSIRFYVQKVGSEINHIPVVASADDKEEVQPVVIMEESKRASTKKPEILS